MTADNDPAQTGSVPIDFIRNNHRNYLFLLGLIFGLTVSVASVATEPSQLSVGRNVPIDQLPFWKKNEKVYKQIIEDRAVIVSVRSEDLPDGVMKFTLNGAGQVSKSKSLCFRLSQQYEKLPGISEHFTKVTFEREPLAIGGGERDGRLLIEAEALGHKAQMQFKVKSVDEPWRSETQWEITSGQFKGMIGFIGYEALPSGKTEMSVHATYQTKVLPIPRVLMGFALEIVIQKVAEKIRSYLESQPST